jgi:predicted RNA-binding protein with PIN domain
MSKSPRIWIVDGHNLIFHTPRLEELQSSGRRREARRQLEDMLRAFAGGVGEKMVVVYDGNRMEGNPDMIREEDFQTVYALPPEEADDRIVHFCRQCMREGLRVRVVTSDLRTLKKNLPEGVSHVTAREFHNRYLRARRAEGKTVRGDFSDVEAELLRRAEEASRRVPKRSRPRKISPHRTPPPPPSPVPAPPPEKKPSLAMPPMSEDAREALRLKKEKGRRRQSRRHGGGRKRSG